MKDNIARIQQRLKEEEDRKTERANELGKKPIDLTRYRNERNFMAFPLFSTSYAKGKDRRSLETYNYDDGVRKFSISPNQKYGMPDQVDANVLRYAISKATEIKRNFGSVPRKIEISRYELCRELGLKPGGKQYNIINDRLNRIAGTQFVGNVFSKDKVFTGTILSFSYSYEDQGGSNNIEIVFNEKLRDVLNEETSCLTIPEEILKLKSPLQIRLMELVRLRMGEKLSWTIGVEKLKLACGVEEGMTARIFKRNLSRLKIPYNVSFSEESKVEKQKVTFTRK